MGFNLNKETDRCLNTIWAIASSRYCQNFLIGFTAQSIKRRMNGLYYRENFDHIVVLSDRLTRIEGLALEQELQNACKRGKARGESFRRKYHPDHRHDTYRASVGNASKIDPLSPIHSVYMIWIEP